MSYSTGQGGHGGVPQGAFTGAREASIDAERWADASLDEAAGFMAPPEGAGAGHHGQREGHAGHGAYTTVAPAGAAWRTALHGLGAVSSIGLVVWIGFWGYGQVMRDVSGVPVVRALEGPMRAVPEQPGGQVSQHTGLAVNAVKAGAPEEALSDTVRLAPSGPALADEDTPTAQMGEPGAATAGAPSEAPVPLAAPGLPIVEAALTAPAEALSGQSTLASPSVEGTSGEAEALSTVAPAAVPAETDAEALARALTEGLAPLASPGAQAGAGEPAALEVVPAAEVVPADIPGVRSSPRPETRPDRLSRIEAQPTLAAFTSADATASLEDMAAVAPGTRLVQLGAFDTVEEARVAWGEIAARFGPLMEDKARVVQQAEAGGRSFWRLRAAGFADLSEARRFCSALVAKRAECIPVVAR